MFFKLKTLLPVYVAGEITIFIIQTKSMYMKNFLSLIIMLLIGTQAICSDKKKGSCDPGTQKKPADTATEKKNTPKNTATTRQPDSKPKAKKESSNDDDDIVAPLSWRPGAFVY